MTPKESHKTSLENGTYLLLLNPHSLLGAEDPAERQKSTIMLRRSSISSGAAHLVSGKRYSLL
jgi:CO dehydrogenase/acetyl-CoA synthase gamma subunit (corrinoid Fe-S protein)